MLLAIVVVTLLGSLIATIIVVTASMLSSRISRHEDLLVEDFDAENSGASVGAATTSPASH